MICGSVGSKSRLAKAAGVESPVQMFRWEMKNCTPLWHEAHFQVKMCKTHHVRTTFGSSDGEKLHAAVARSTFAAVARSTFVFGPLLEVQLSKNCTTLRREAHFQVKMLSDFFLHIFTWRVWESKCPFSKACLQFLMFSLSRIPNRSTW